MKVYRDIEQGSMEWHMLRRGIPTASGFDRICTGAKGEASKQADEYSYELIGDLYSDILPEAAEHFTNRAIRHGLNCEAEARRWYAFERNLDVEEVGFCVSDCGRWGCSPDGLVGEYGGLELKCPQAKTQVAYLLKLGLPNEYKPQVHGSLIVTGRKWWDFMSYSPGLPPLLVRVTPDEYTEKLRKHLEAFSARLESLRLAFAAKYPEPVHLCGYGMYGRKGHGGSRHDDIP